MAEKLIGSLIYGEHAVPKKGLPLQQKITRAVIVLAILSLATFLVYKFINYREERRVTYFLDAVTHNQYEQAYLSWDADGRYNMADFLSDWGKDGYYTKGMHQARVVNSKGQGVAVVVCIELDNHKQKVPIRVEKQSLKLSYSPVDKCN
jgi:hypothetical protein